MVCFIEIHLYLRVDEGIGLWMVHSAFCSSSELPEYQWVSAVQVPVDVMVVNDEGEVSVLNEKKESSRVNSVRSGLSRIHRARTSAQRRLGARIADVDIESRNVRVVQPIGKNVQHRNDGLRCIKEVAECVISDNFCCVNYKMACIKKILYETLAAYAVLLFFLTATLILTYLNISQLWEPFVLEHLEHQALTTAR